MALVSPFLRTVKHGDRDAYAHWCPGCQHAHVIFVSGEHPYWTFNGDVNRPSFQPSIRIFTPAHEDEGEKFQEETICHYFITDGVIEFCGDCRHEMKGQKVALPELPPADAYRYGGDVP